MTFWLGFIARKLNEKFEVTFFFAFIVSQWKILSSTDSKNCSLAVPAKIRFGVVTRTNESSRPKKALTCCVIQLSKSSKKFKPHPGVLDFYIVAKNLHKLRIFHCPLSTMRSAALFVVLGRSAGSCGRYYDFRWPSLRFLYFDRFPSTDCKVTKVGKIRCLGAGYFQLSFCAFQPFKLKQRQSDRRHILLLFRLLIAFARVL